VGDAVARICWPGLRIPPLTTQDVDVVPIRKGQGVMKVCPECHGRGRIEDEDGNIVTCPECHGSGVVDDHDDDPGTIREPPG
jgi:hypothetical protein